MTAKEKAHSIIKNFRGFGCITCYGPDANIITAKQCAELAVYEIMLAIGWAEMDPDDKDSYWDDVLKEIKQFKI